jgi:hypothetical protein
VDFAPNQTYLLGAIGGSFFTQLDAAGRRLPQELEDILYWNGVFAGRRVADGVLRDEQPRRTSAIPGYHVDIRRLVISPFPTEATPRADLEVLGLLLQELSATLIAAGVRLLVPLP